jgi:hypothetical protein
MCAESQRGVTRDGGGFCAAIDDHLNRVFFKFLFRTGAREKEATHLEWSNLNLGEKSTITFRNQSALRPRLMFNRCVWQTCGRGPQSPLLLPSK